MGKLINIDNGGTLTDIWVLDGNTSYHTKTITTPYDLSKCFFEGLKKVSGVIYGEENLPALLQSTDHIRYSTTQGTNALIEKKGPRLGLIIDRGISLHSLQSTPKETDLFRSMLGDRVKKLDGALDETGHEKALLEAINQLSAEGANRIVVACSGENYLAKEASIRRISLALFPRHLLGAIPMLFAGSLSSDQSFDRRVWTALINAFLHPSMEHFLFNAENKLREYRVKNPLLIYRNDGFAGRVAKTVALKTYSSGPRAGMESARAYADYYGFKRFVTMDVGGTTTDIGYVEKGQVKVLKQGAVEGISSSLPLCDIESIGLGGGSIFCVKAGEITVGPDSVGGAPGPACFGMGGKEATITDVLLLMGLLDPKTYFGGQMALDGARARAVVAKNIAEPLGVTVEQAIYSMLKTWAEKVANGLVTYLRNNNTELYSDTTLTAFGGGGPMGVLAVAEAAGLNSVLIPRLSAVFSAHGIGFSDIAHAAELKLAAQDGGALEATVYHLKQTVSYLKQTIAHLKQKVTRDMFSEGFEIDDCQLQAWLCVNGKDQVLDLHEPTLPEFPGVGDDVIVGLRAIKAVNRAELPEKVAVGKQEARIDSLRLLTQADGSIQELPVIKVEDQQPGAFGYGPAIIEEDFWTCNVLEGWTYAFTANGDVRLKKEAG